MSFLNKRNVLVVAGVVGSLVLCALLALSFSVTAGDEVKMVQGACDHVRATCDKVDFLVRGQDVGQFREDHGRPPEPMEVDAGLASVLLSGK